MKTILFYFSTILIFCLFVISCNKEGSSALNPETGSELTAAFIGKQHNRFVDDFYQKMGKTPSTRTNNIEDGNSLGEEISSYIFEHGLPGYIDSDVITTEEAEAITPFIEEQLYFLNEIAKENSPENFFKFSLDNALQLGALSKKTHEFLISNINGDIDAQAINQRLRSI